jgi:protein-disulfide isomerase
MEKTNWIIALVVGALVGFFVGHFTAGPSAGGSVAGGAPSFGLAKGGGDTGKTPNDLPPSYIKEAEFPAGTFANMTEAQKYTALKVANERNCTCGCPNDTIAKCRTHDPSCATAPQLLTEVINSAKQGKSAQEIINEMNKPSPAAGRAADDASVVFKVPVQDSPQRGQADAKVTIVEFSDFQCPFCSKAEVTVDQVREAYGADVRVIYKQNPLPFHPHATPAAKASLAAGQQGKFWEMHDLLFKNQQHLEQADFEGYAKQLGLNVDTFKADLASTKFDAMIDRDKALASKLGASGTPAFFINGHKLVGAQPLEKFKALIDEQKSVAEKKLASGTSAAGLYEALIASGVDAPAAAQPPPGAPAPAAAKKVEVAGFNPVRGPKAAPVTMVMWSDFQCPFCSRVEPTVKQVEETYGSKVKVVWRNEPLPFHNNAMPAAKAAMAAAEQGKFWEMHDKLFDNQQKLSAGDLEGYARDIGLDLGKWKTDMESDKVKNEIAEDQKAGSAVGANGTPAFYINGKELSGAQPFDSFKTIIDEQLTKADELQKKGVKLDDLYAKLIEANMGSAANTAPGAPVHGADDMIAVNIGDAPSRGPKNAPITLVEFSDFQCPFCSRGYSTVNDVEKAYEGKVKVVFKQNPLPFHNNAMPAAQASLAAGEQGKFWQMYDVLFQHQQQLSRENLDSYAQQIGLNMDKFKAAMDSGKFKAKVEADLEEGRKAGVSGTPTFVINGHKLVGAQPLEQFKTIIDAELAKGAGPAGRKVAGK